MKTDEYLKGICHHLVQGEIGHEAVMLNPDEFQRLYRIMVDMRGGKVPVLSIVNLQSSMVAQFSDVAPQHFLITGTSKLSRRSFGFMSNLVWHGPESRSQSFFGFVLEELRQSFVRLLFVFLASTIALYVADSDSLYEQLTSLLITSATVFLTIYLIFTVAQSQTLQGDRSLFEKGVIQRYYQDDRHVTLIAILTIALVFANSAFLTLATKYQLSIYLGQLQVNSSFWKAISTALVVTLLFYAFFTVVDYYLERSRDVAERNVVSDILHDDFKKHDGQHRLS